MLRLLSTVLKKKTILCPISRFDTRIKANNFAGYIMSKTKIILTVENRQMHYTVLLVAHNEIEKKEQMKIISNITGLSF